MAIQHSVIAEADLHEPKGVSTSSTGHLSTANAGVVNWAYPIFTLHLDIVDIVADTSYFVAVPYAGDIVKWYTCIDNAITTADCSMTLEIATVAVTDSAITITQVGSAVGDVDSATPSAANSVAADGSIEVIVSGTNATATRCHVTIIYQRTA